MYEKSSVHSTYLHSRGKRSAAKGKRNCRKQKESGVVPGKVQAMQTSGYTPSTRKSGKRARNGNGETRREKEKARGGGGGRGRLL